MIERRFSKQALKTERSEQDPTSATTLVGTAALYEVTNNHGRFFERIRSGAFSRAIAEKQDVKCLLNHSPSLLLGRTTSGTCQLFDDPQGLRFRVTLPQTSLGADVGVLVGRGDLDECSFAFGVVEEVWEWEGDGEGGSRLVRELIDLDLFDVSPVTYPANVGTSLSIGANWNSMFPEGVPPEVRAHVGQSASTRAATATRATDCSCECSACEGGDCSECSNDSCVDPECVGCPAQADDAGARAARRRRIQLVEADL